MIIYKIKNIENGKIYIGETTKTLNKRLSEHRKRIKAGYKLPLYDDVRKYGFDSFVVEQIDTAKTQNELYAKEKKWIKHYSSIVPNGYNLTDGGKGTVNYHHTEEDKIKMRKLKLGKYDGKNNPFYGKHHSEEQIAKWKKERSGRKLTKEWKENISKTRKRKPIINIDTREVFESARHVARYYGKNPDSGVSSAIAKVCKKIPKYNTCMGYRFEYYEPKVHDNTVPSLRFLKEGVTTIRKE